MRFDHDWHRRALAGQASALNELADAVLTPVYRLCFYRLAEDRHLAEDATQETLLSAIRQLSTYDPGRAGGEILPWIRGLALNAVRTIAARSERTRSLEGLWDSIDQELTAALARLEDTALPEKILQRQETQRLVATAMSQLPDRYRQALEAKYLEGQSTRELAQVLHLSEVAADSLLKRARSALRETLTVLGHHFKPETA